VRACVRACMHVCMYACMYVNHWVYVMWGRFLIINGERVGVEEIIYTLHGIFLHSSTKT